MGNIFYTKADGGTDLFRWQTREPLTDLPEATRRDLMNEHTLDWLLCNFETKGENFINQEHGHMEQIRSAIATRANKVMREELIASRQTER